MRDRNTARGGGWIDSFDASYAYGRTWFLFGFPLLGLLGIYLAWVSGSGAAQIVALAAELLFILVFVEYRTYYVRIKNGRRCWR
jgi:hypothetical protein